MHQYRFLFIFPSSELGGAERQGLHLARYLKSNGCKVSVWSSIGGKGIVVEKCEAAGIPWDLHRFLWPCRKTSLIRDGLKLLLALWRERPDVILTYTTSPNVGCGLVWKLTPAKVCMWGQRNVNCLRGDKVERFAYRQVSAVVCNSGHSVDYLNQTLGVTSTPIHVVHNGVNLSECQKNIEQWRAELGLSRKSIIVTMVANFRRQKDHPTLLRAWRKVLLSLRDLEVKPHLLLAGAPLESYENVKQLIYKLGLNETVTLLGQVDDVSGLLSASDIGALISHYEGLSNAVIEYMASGLPVIATDLPGNREALGEIPGQPFCRTRSVESISECLINLISDSNLRKKLGKANFDRAKEKFSIEAMCKATSEIIFGILNKK